MGTHGVELVQARTITRTMKTRSLTIVSSFVVLLLIHRSSGLSLTHRTWPSPLPSPSSMKLQRGRGGTDHSTTRRVGTPRRAVITSGVVAVPTTVSLASGMFGTYGGLRTNGLRPNLYFTKDIANVTSSGKPT